jgi:hypothetical protein
VVSLRHENALRDREIAYALRGLEIVVEAV